MPVSEKKKASNARWNAANMTTLGCSVRREQAEQFKCYAAKHGKTANTLLKEYVLSCIHPEAGDRKSESGNDSDS